MEMDKLIEMLEAAGIPFDISEACGAPQVCYPVGPAGDDNCICDVICHNWSYGGYEGLLEIMGLVPEDCGDDVEGYLTAEAVFSRIKAHYEGRWPLKEEEEEEVIYTYNKSPDYYTEESNAAMDYVMRNLAGVTVTAEKGNLVQVSAIKEAAKAIEILSQCDVMVAYQSGMTIEDVEKMLNE